MLINYTPCFKCPWCQTKILMVMFRSNHVAKGPTIPQKGSLRVNQEVTRICLESRVALSVVLSRWAARAPRRLLLPWCRQLSEEGKVAPLPAVRGQMTSHQRRASRLKMTPKCTTGSMGHEPLVDRARTHHSAVILNHARHHAQILSGVRRNV